MADDGGEGWGEPVAGVDKVEILGKASEDGPNAATFAINGEDHTLGNALQYVLNKNPAVDFTGYTVPHPSEMRLHLRIQTKGSITAVDALRDALNTLRGMSDHVRDTFEATVEAHARDNPPGTAKK